MSDASANHCDFLIIGGGIVGLTVALAIRHQWPGASVSLLEKEDQCGLHASGRNSGVLHAGFYYSEDSLKARLTRTGNERLTRYCLDNRLPIDRCGKLVVASRADELPWLDELARRGAANGVELHLLGESEVAAIEPRARTFSRALFSPTTAVVAPSAVLASLAADARRRGVVIATETRYVGRDRGAVRTNRGSYSAGFVVNAAGLYADRVAHDYGFGRDYRILPFKGLYLVSDGSGPDLGTNIYPVPDPRYPFLGVHFTRSLDGALKIGPTAMPALWREQYGGTGGFRFDELVEIGVSEAMMFAKNSFGFRSLALREIRKHSKRFLLRLASRLVPDVRSNARWAWGNPGIRAQLYHVERNALVEDFVIEGDSSSMHILNAVSPAFTCALPFADLVVEGIDRQVSNRRPGAPCGQDRGAKSELGKTNGSLQMRTLSE